MTLLHGVRASQIAAGLVSLAAGISLAFVLWGPSFTDLPGRVVLVEVFILSLMAVLPVAWRFRCVGIGALTEPLCVMSGAFLLYYVLRGLVLLFRHSIAHPDRILLSNPATNSDLALTLAYVIVGFGLFHAGYRFWNDLRPEFVLSTAWSSQSLKRVATAGIILATLSTVVLVYASGGLGNAMQYFGCLRIVTAGYGYALLGLPYWGIVFVFLLWDRLNRRKNIILPLILLGLCNICDASLGNRTGILAMWGAAVLLHFYGARYSNVFRSMALLLFVLGIGVAFALPMARVREACYFTAMKARNTPPAEHRRLNTDLDALWNNLSYSAANTGLVDGGNVFLQVSGEFIALDSFSTVVAAGPADFPFQYGKTYLDTMLFVVPRVLWPNKPRSFSYSIGQYLAGVDTGIPPGYVGELYLNFHLPGIIIGMYLMGVALRKAHLWTLSGDASAIVAYSVLAPYLVIFMGRDLIGGGVITIIEGMLMLPVVYYLRKTRLSATSSGILQLQPMEMVPQKGAGL